jgi:hypothetical protein
MAKEKLAELNALIASVTAMKWLLVHSRGGLLPATPLQSNLTTPVTAEKEPRVIG